MLEISLIVIMNISLLSLVVVLILLFVKHLNYTHVFIEDLRENQLLLYQEILDLKLDLTKGKVTTESKSIKENNISSKVQTSEDINNLKSTPVSKEELAKLIEGKNLAFKKEVSANSGDMFINTDIEI